MNNTIKTQFEDALIEICPKHKKFRILSISQRENPVLKQLQTQNMFLGNSYQATIGIAVGQFKAGNTPIIYSPDTNILSRTFNLIEELICKPNLNIKIAGPADLIDLKLAHSLSNIRIISPADIKDHKQLTKILLDDFGPTYIRLSNDQLT